MFSKIQKGMVLFATLTLLAAPFYILSTPKPVHAQAGTAACIGAALGWVESLFTTPNAVVESAYDQAVAQLTMDVPVVEVPQYLALMGLSQENIMDGFINGTVSWKECILDPAIWAIKMVAIESLTAAIVEWIRSGFEGSPTFVTDLDGFLLDVADRVAGDFIVGTGLGVLCSPFQLDVRMRLLKAYYSDWESSETICKLTDVVENIEKFMDGDFFEGGWQGWMRMSMYPSGNPTGSYLVSGAELHTRIRSKTGEELKMVQWAKGFLSPRDENGNIITPGSYVEEQLNDWTGSGLANLEIADEVDEIIGALLSELVQQILTGSGGLAGSGDYLQRLRNGSQQACLELKEDLIAKINAQIATEQAAGRTQYLTQLNDLLARAQAVQCSTLPDDTVTLRQIKAEFESLLTSIGVQRVCSDGLDNDSDGKVDYPNDPGCTSSSDSDETDTSTQQPMCSDGLDNDSDGKTDYPNDPGCENANDNNETDGSSGGPTEPPPAPPAMCADTLDNDGDGKIDYPNDPGCENADDNDETDNPNEPPPPDPL